MRTNRDKSVAIIAKAYKTEPSVIAAVISSLMDHGDVRGVPYWGQGDLNYADLNNMVKAMRLVGVIQGDVDWAQFVDDRFLPDDLRGRKGELTESRVGRCRCSLRKRRGVRPRRRLKWRVRWL